MFRIVRFPGEFCFIEVYIRSHLFVISLFYLKTVFKEQFIKQLPAVSIFINGYRDQIIYLRKTKDILLISGT